MATDLMPDVGGGAMGQERKKMRKVLSRFDIVFFTIAAFISLDTIALTAAYGGGETFFWLIVTLLIWLLPYGMIVAELGSTFPVEGGPYAWPRMAFGRLAGSLTSVFYWMSNPVWMGGSLAAVTVATINTFYLKDPMGTRGLHRRRHPRGVGHRRALADRAEVGQVDGHPRHDRPVPRARHLPGPGRRVPGDQGQARGHGHHLGHEAHASPASSPSSACCSSSSSASSSPPAPPKR